MAFTKPQIYNLALNALLLQRRVTDPDTDKSNEVKVLNTNWDLALSTTLEDLDLDSTSTQKDLELMGEDPNKLWKYYYKYPIDCVFLRRIQSCARTDDISTHIPKRVAILDGDQVIMTNEYQAIAEYISDDTPVTALSSPAVMCLAARLAQLSSPLITGKGARSLIEQLEKKYIIFKAEAQQHDANENFNFVDIQFRSEFVRARTE